MTLLDKHLEQIELCASTIEALPFPGPRRFTNAMLHTQDITTLIRDTEAHERALFSLTTSEKAVPSSRASTAGASRRKTALNASEASEEPVGNFRAPRKGTAVAAVLGGVLHDKIKTQVRKSATDTRGDGRAPKDNLDVELLLQGAEKLCGVYPIPGALERIDVLRSHNQKVLESMAQYEDLVSEQSKQLGRMNRPSSFGFEDDSAADELLAHAHDQVARQEETPMTVEDLRIEESEITELERKKRKLEERVSNMEKDLGGLMR